MNQSKLVEAEALPNIIANTSEGAFVILMITLDLVLVRRFRLTSKEWTDTSLYLWTVILL